MWVDSGRRQELVGEEVRRLSRSESSSQSDLTPKGSRRDGDDAIPDFGDAYIVASRVDFTDIWKSLFSHSRPNDLTAQDLAFRGILTDNPQLDAYATIAPDSTAEIVLSEGLFWALEDLVTRLVCLDGFAGDPDDERRLEAEFVRSESFIVDNDFQISPEIRYFDYHFRMRRKTGRDTALSCFYTVFPLTSERKALAQLILRIGILWVMLHEESHHALGHLRYNRDALGVASRRYTLNETARTEAVPQGNVSKVFEWQADREATRGVVDVVMRQAVLDQLPSRYRSPAWLFRFAVVAMGCVIMLFDRARLFQKARGIIDDVGSHPTERTRLLSASYHALERNISQVRDGPELRLTRSDAHSAVHGAVGDIAIANRPGARELWPFPANWRPNPNSVRSSEFEDVLHLRDGGWDEGPFDPFENVTLHINADALVGSFLMSTEGVLDPFGKPGEDEILHEVYNFVLRHAPPDAPEFSYDTFVNIFRSWVTEFSSIMRDHNSRVWDLLDGYRWYGSLA